MKIYLLIFYILVGSAVAGEICEKEYYQSRSKFIERCLTGETNFARGVWDGEKFEMELGYYVYGSEENLKIIETEGGALFLIREIAGIEGEGKVDFYLYPILKDSSLRYSFSLQD